MNFRSDLEAKRERLIAVIVEGGVFGEAFAKEWVDHIVSLSKCALLEEQSEYSDLAFEQLKEMSKLVFSEDSF